VVGENCDDGSNDGLGCNLGCVTGQALGYTCTGGSPTTSSTCTPICGDGLLRGVENCDMNMAWPGYGCNSNCIGNFPGWSCSLGIVPAVCNPVCGDGLVVVGENCDDGLNDGAGCEFGC
jgi:cysteine-rich repeat protein